MRTANKIQNIKSTKLLYNNISYKDILQVKLVSYQRIIIFCTFMHKFKFFTKKLYKKFLFGNHVFEKEKFIFILAIN